MAKTKEVVAKVAPEVAEVPVVVYPTAVVYDTEDGNDIKIVTAREARSPRYKPV